MIFQAQAMGAVKAYIDSTLDKSDDKPDYDVYVVWFCKTLRNWKALVSSTLPDRMYYEVTYNGEAREMYIDVYSKVNNIVIPDDTSLKKSVTLHLSSENQS